MIVTIKTSLIPLSTFLVFLLLSTFIIAQVNNFKNNEKIRISATEFLQILRCKGEEEKKVCEVAYFVNNKRVGSPFWLTINAIQKKEQVIKKEIKKPILKAPTTDPKPASKSKIPQPTVPNKVESKLRPAEEKQKSNTISDFATQLKKAMGSKEEKLRDSLQKIVPTKTDSLNQHEKSSIASW